MTQSSKLAENSGGSPSVRRAAGVSLLVVLTLAAAWLLTGPQRQERNWRQATLPQLLAQVSDHPDSAPLFYDIALCARQTGQSAVEMKAFWRAANLAPDDTDIWVTWSEATAQTQGRQAARSILTTFLQLHPTNARAHRALSELYVAIGDYPHAYQEALTATKYDPRDAAAWHILGVEALKTQNPAMAEAAFRHAIALRPGSGTDCAGLGDALFMQSHFAEALTFYREAEQRGAGNSATNLALGVAQMKTANSPVEIEAARQSLRDVVGKPSEISRSGLYMASLTLGKSYEREARWREALPWLLKAEQIELPMPEISDDAHFELSRVYRETQNPVGAVREAALHQRQAEFNAQVGPLTSKLLSKPDDTQTALELARVYVTNGDDQDAAQVYHILLNHQQNQAEARQGLAALLRRHSLPQNNLSARP